jgi:hypothetical protein
MIAFVSRSFSDLGKTRSERNTREKATEKPGYRNRSRLFSLLNRTQASVVHRCFVGLRLLSYEDLCRQAIGKSDPEWPLPPQSPRRRAKTSGQRREGFLLPLALTLPSRSPPRPRRYALRKVSRSPLMVSALVVGMPRCAVMAARCRRNDSCHGCRRSGWSGHDRAGRGQSPGKSIEPAQI